MKTIPLSELDSATTDICVVGSGPVGLTLAAELAGKGMKVLLLEAGGARPSPEAQAEVQAIIAPGSPHAPMPLAVCRAFGGTSWLWGGRCVAFDAVDFAPREWIPNSGWPIQEDDVSPYYQRAASALGCGSANFAAEPVFHATPDLVLDRLERWCNKPVLPNVRNRDDLPDGLTVCLKAKVDGMIFSSDKSRVIGLSVSSGARIATFRGAALFVLACGGLETARLLLNVQQKHPELFGGPEGPLGRHYMGHISGHIADIVFEDPRQAKLFRYVSRENASVRRRIMLGQDIQAADRLPNISFSPSNPKMSDPAHGSGILSVIFLLLCLPSVGQRLISEAIRQMQMTKHPRFGLHLRNIILDLPRTAATLLGLAWQKFLVGRQKPFLFLLSRNGAYPLHYHAEHIGHADSRVQLGGPSNPQFDRPLRIAQKFTADDAAGVVRAHHALDRLLRSSGLGYLNFRDPEKARSASVLDQARDGFHQMGVMRMGTDATDGVVDKSCRIFGLDNLFLAGSGVFRTSGQANPTFFATALSLRLADHLAERIRGARP